MKKLILLWESWAPQLRSVLRIFAGIMFFQVGTMKLFGYPISMPNGHTADFLSEIWFAGFLEVVGGALVVIGLFTRPAAFLLAGEMAIAYFQAHAPKSIWTVVNGGASAVLFCFVFLYFSAAGGGNWSIDEWLKKRK